MIINRYAKIYIYINIPGARDVLHLEPPFIVIQTHTVVHPFAASHSRRTICHSFVVAIRRLVVVLCCSMCGSRGRLGVRLFKLLFAVIRRALVNDH